MCQTQSRKRFSDCASFSYYIDRAKLVKWLLWENVEHSNFNCWLRKGCQRLTSRYDFFFIKRRFCHSILLCFERSSLLLNCITPDILFVILNMFSLLFVCTFTHCLLVLFFVFFSFVFLLSKTPRKAVLFHEYQASTGRFNKFVSVLPTSLPLLWTLCQGMCVCLSL